MVDSKKWDLPNSFSIFNEPFLFDLRCLPLFCSLSAFSVTSNDGWNSKTGLLESLSLLSLLCPNIRSILLDKSSSILGKSELLAWSMTSMIFAIFEPLEMYVNNLLSSFTSTSLIFFEVSITWWLLSRGFSLWLGILFP